MKNPKLNKILSVFILLISVALFSASLIVLIKYFLITLSGLHEPVFKWVKMLLSEEKIKNGLMFQITVALKILSLLIAGGFIFLIYSALSTAAGCLFYKFCSRNYKKIGHPLKFSFFKGIKWSFYRTFLVLAPPASVITAGSLLMFSSTVLFNLFLKIAGVSITLTAFLISFVSFGIMFLFMLSLLVSLWQLVSTLFGSEISISEPRLENKTIETRSKKLIFADKYNVFLCISYLVLISTAVFQLKYALVSDLLTNPGRQHFLNSMITYNLLGFAVFEYLKASGYINSLIEYSRRISKSPIKIFAPYRQGNL